MDNLNKIQQELNDWRVKNFGKPNGNHQIMGIMEEVGELTHAKLKWDQGIRGYDEEKAKAEMSDAIGDIMIYAMGLCDVYDWKLSDIIDATAMQVLKRDWKKNSIDGK